jgi:hypothetical protein
MDEDTQQEITSVDGLNRHRYLISFFAQRSPDVPSATPEEHANSVDSPMHSPIGEPQTSRHGLHEYDPFPPLNGSECSQSFE